MSRYILDLKKNIENNFFIKLLELFKSKNFIFKIKKYSKLFFTLSRPGMVNSFSAYANKKNKYGQDLITNLHTKNVNEVKSPLKIDQTNFKKFNGAKALKKISFKGIYVPKFKAYKSKEKKLIISPLEFN